MPDDQVQVHESPDLPLTDDVMVEAEKIGEHNVVETVDIDVLLPEIPSIEGENVVVAEPTSHDDGEFNATSVEIPREKEAKPEIPNGVVARVCFVMHDPDCFIDSAA